MKEIKEYYVVGLYENINELPYKVYKITINFEEALNVYINYISNPKCYIGYYYNNKLTSCSKFMSFSADGSGLFKTAKQVITIDMIENYEED